MLELPWQHHICLSGTDEKKFGLKCLESRVDASKISRTHHKNLVAIWLPRALSNVLKIV